MDGFSSPNVPFGAYAGHAGFALVTRDVARYRTDFPTVKLVVPR